MKRRIVALANRLCEQALAKRSRKAPAAGRFPACRTIRTASAESKNEINQQRILPSMRRGFFCKRANRRLSSEPNCDTIISEQ